MKEIDILKVLYCITKDIIEYNPKLFESESTLCGNCYKFICKKINTNFECFKCEEIICNECIIQCAVCDIPICENCVYSKDLFELCSICDKYVCPDCLTFECDLCNLIPCENCASRCSNEDCDSFFCKYCIKHHNCQNS